MRTWLLVGCEGSRASGVRATITLLIMTGHKNLKGPSLRRHDGSDPNRSSGRTLLLSHRNRLPLVGNGLGIFSCCIRNLPHMPSFSLIFNLFHSPDPPNRANKRETSKCGNQSLPSTRPPLWCHPTLRDLSQPNFLRRCLPLRLHFFILVHSSGPFRAASSGQLWLRSSKAVL